MEGSVFRWQFILITVIASSTGFRLSRSVLPSFYNLTIDIIEEKYKKFGATFVGEVAITLQTNQNDVYEITLHKDSLDISSCLVYNMNDLLYQNVTISSLIFNPKTQLLTVPLLEPLTANENYTLYFKYTGNVRYDYSGLFKIADNHSEVLLTQLKTIYARLVFPCFDEPTFKAKFQLHLGRPSGYNAISNTRLLRTTNEGNERFVDHFDVTPIMSTYLLAFLISEYQAQGDISKFTIFTPPDYYNYTGFSYGTGVRVTDAYNELFEMPYNQLGNEVLQFATAPWIDEMATENWGLIIFSEKMLVHKPGYTDYYKNKEFTCRAIGKEVAHMWFGNSVTLSWWSHYWLNEGFARYYGIIIADENCRSYHLDQQFVVDSLQRIFEKDAVAGSLPLTSLEMSVQSLADINKQTDGFIEDKGASIIRMWRNLMGGKNFKISIDSYLKQYHLKNTNPSDLFAHLRQNWPAQHDVDLDTFFSDFTEQVGYPMVIVNITQDNQKIILHQKRFLYDYEDGSDATLRYTIPITLTTNLDRIHYNLTPYTYFKKNETTVEISFENPIKWIILNQKQSNYYRVFYEQPILNQIKQLFSTIKSRRIPIENKAQIIDDLFHFAHAGMIDYADVFEFLEFLSTEMEYIPWRAAYNGMERVVRRLNPQQLTHFEKYLTNITTLVFSLRGTKSGEYEGILTKYNREMHVKWLCKYQNVNCNNQVKFLFEGNIGKPSPDYRETFYCAVSRTTAHARLWHLYNNETNSDEKDLLLRAISCSRDYSTYFKLELFHVIPHYKHTNDLIQIYKHNPDLIGPIFSMISENIDEFVARLGKYEMIDVLSDMVDYFTTREQEEQFTIFMDRNIHRFGESAETLKETFLTTIRKNLEWAEQRLGKLGNYLAKYN